MYASPTKGVSTTLSPMRGTLLISGLIPQSGREELLRGIRCPTNLALNVICSRNTTGVSSEYRGIESDSRQAVCVPDQNTASVAFPQPSVQTVVCLLNHACAKRGRGCVLPGRPKSDAENERARRPGVNYVKLAADVHSDTYRDYGIDFSTRRRLLSRTTTTW